MSVLFLLSNRLQHPDVATSYNNLATVLRDHDDLEKAQEYEELAHAIILFSLLCFTVGDK